MLLSDTARIKNCAASLPASSDLELSYVVISPRDDCLEKSLVLGDDACLRPDGSRQPQANSPCLIWRAACSSAWGSSVISTSASIAASGRLHYEWQPLDRCRIKSVEQACHPRYFNTKDAPAVTCCWGLSLHVLSCQAGRLVVLNMERNAGTDLKWKLQNVDNEIN